MKHINVKIQPLHFSSIFILSLLIIAIGLTACRKNENTRKLETAERIVGNNPDSARKILNSIDTTALSRDGKMLRRLFLLEASDKLYEEHKDDKEIAALISYFIDGNHVKRVHPLVYYYGGRVYTDLGDDAKALRYFKNALKTLPRGVDTDLEGRIHSQLSYLYGAHKMYLHARNHIQAAIELSKQERDLVNIIGGSLNLADIYIFQHRMDSAEIIYDSLMKYVKECKDSVTISTYYTQLAIFYYHDNKLEKADSVIRHHTFVYDNVSRASVLTIINRINRLCHGEKVDEELYESLLKDPDQMVRYGAHIRLAEAAEAKGDGKSMLKYTKEALREVNAIQKKFNKSSLMEMEKMIDEQELENANLQLTLANQRSRNVILTITMLAIVIIGFCISVIIRGRMKRMKQELDASLTLAREKENIMKLLFDGNGKVTEEDFARLREALKEVYPRFIERLDGMGLKPKDYQDAMFAKIDVPQKICADFFGVTPGGISNQRRRLLQKWQPDGEFRSWKEYLDSL